jgi:hypothetical protein
MTRATHTKQFGTSLVVERFEIDWDNLAWCTLRRLLEEPGPARLSDAGIERVFRRALAIRLWSVPCLYMNPQFTVSAMHAGPAFVTAAQHAQQRWLRTVKRLVGSAANLKRQLQQSSSLLKQLQFTGVLIVTGKHTCHGLTQH